MSGAAKVCLGLVLLGLLLVGVGPLAGLGMAIRGMHQVFGRVQAADQVSSPDVLAGGIKASLLFTVLGMGIAVVGLAVLVLAAVLYLVSLRRESPQPPPATMPPPQAAART